MTEREGVNTVTRRWGNAMELILKASHDDDNSGFAFDVPRGARRAQKDEQGRPVVYSGPPFLPIRADQPTPDEWSNR
jgi:hypothetical protein